VNRIQNIRKSNGFEITDKINVTLSSNEQTDAAIEAYKEYICTQVQATALNLTETVKGTELDFDDFKLVAHVEKA
jgi:isoleucyl-tRNA synthetase